ncbi:MAG: hypothetical protein VCA18_04425 [Opitutales bacterium]
MADDKFPAPPEPTGDFPAERSSLPPIVWWIVAGIAVITFITFIFFLPSQCGLENIETPSPAVTDPNEQPVADQETELELRKDQLWYKIGAEKAFTGAAVEMHPNGKMKSRTLMKDGISFGLIEEWDVNGSVVGTKFKDEL